MKKTGKRCGRLAAALLAGVFAFGAFGAGCAAAQTNDEKEETVRMKQASVEAFGEDTRVFAADASVTVKKAHFQNRYGVRLAGDLYLPAGFDAAKRYAAVVLSGPFGAVKEQVSGLYAQELAKAGFVAVAFDPSFTGESGGGVRNVASPDLFTEDFSAAVDFVGLLPYVDRARIGAVGICGLSGPAVTAAVNDIRIRAVAVSAMYDMTDSIRNHYQGDFYTAEQREAVKRYLADMRWQEAERGEAIPGYHEVALDADGNAVRPANGKLFPDTLPDGADPVTREFFDYYRGRAYHARSVNSAAAWSSTTPYGFFNFPLCAHAEELSPRPILLITGEAAHSKYHSDRLYEAAREPKELIAVPGATHTDLYDRMDKIPFDRLAAYFRAHLIQPADEKE